MTTEELSFRGLENEVQITASRSSGAGGQNVNKVNTKIELRFNVLTSSLLTDEEKLLVSTKLKTQINNDGELIITSQDDRSQFRNKKNSIEKFYEILAKALTKRKKRKPTAPSAGSKEKRLQTKRHMSEKKVLRKKIE
jgi:ribosome-associated protein